MTPDLSALVNLFSWTKEQASTLDPTTGVLALLGVAAPGILSGWIRWAVRGWQAAAFAGRGVWLILGAFGWLAAGLVGAAVHAVAYFGHVFWAGAKGTAGLVEKVTRPWPELEPCSEPKSVNLGELAKSIVAALGMSSARVEHGKVISGPVCIDLSCGSVSVCDKPAGSRLSRDEREVILSAANAVVNRHGKIETDALAAAVWRSVTGASEADVDVAVNRFAVEGNRFVSVH